MIEFLPAAALMMASIIGAAWCVVRGSTIGASAMVEKPETSVWGLVLNVMGALILLFGFTAALMLIIPESFSFLMIIAGEVGVAACTFPIITMLGRFGSKSPDEIFPRVATWATTFIVIIAATISIMSGGDAVAIFGGAWPLLLGTAIMILTVIILFPRVATLATTFIVILAASILITSGGSVGNTWLFLLGAVTMILAVLKIFPQVANLASIAVAILIFSIFVMMSGGGGDVGVIPESAWPLLLGTVTMLGAAACAAICIMVAVKSGSAAMMEKPELSIWSLLFVALGEGLAIYGLIVALLIVMA